MPTRTARLSPEDGTGLPGACCFVAGVGSGPMRRRLGTGQRRSCSAGRWWWCMEVIGSSSIQRQACKAMLEVGEHMWLFAGGMGKGCRALSRLGRAPHFVWSVTWVLQLTCGPGAAPLRVSHANACMYATHRCRSAACSRVLQEPQIAPRHGLLGWVVCCGCLWKGAGGAYTCSAICARLLHCRVVCRWHPPVGRRVRLAASALVGITGQSTGIRVKLW